MTAPSLGPVERALVTDIRDADPADIEPLARLWHASWRDAHAAIVPADLVRVRTLESFHDRLAAARGGVRIAGPPGAPLGFTYVRGAELNQIFVAAEARGSGVAAALIADAEARLRAAGVTTAWLDCAVGNDRAARFYEKAGWRRAATMVSELETPAGVIPLDVWRYEKRLAG